MFRNIITVLSLLSSVFIFANNTAPESIFDKMSYTEVLEVTLEADYTEVLANRRSNKTFPGKLKFADVNNQFQLWNVDISLRGKFRRMKCEEMPPLKIEFSKDDLFAGGLSRSNDLKLVTQCVEDEKAAKELVLREYLAYKMYNEITKASFRVQLLKINYKDFHTGKNKNHWAFLIEDTAQMRTRIGGKKVKKSESFEKSDLNDRLTRSTAIFQYMIGNYDWDLFAKKNVKLVRIDSSIVPVPYDFDFSGMVNAPYAKGNAALKVFTRYDRIYLGPDADNSELKSIFKYFKSKHPQLISIVKNCEELSSAGKRDMIKYIDTFFQNGPDFFTKSDLAESNTLQAK